MYPRWIAVFGFYNDLMVDAERLAAAEEMRRLRPFWRDGRILRWPARESRRRLLLAEVVQLFPRGTRLSEAEVDAILRNLWSDHCQLRRALVDYELLNRKDGVYWRVG
ncbi:MAG TPA: DUF2087 domain-containing protein [Candidatus Dormibacteraeota bacterium]|nr:DUF2087 domain-containing protein [Candidatus Dormibacteraeota bacterium]